MRTNLRISFILRAQGGFNLNAFAGVERRQPDFPDPGWSEQTRHQTNSIPNAEFASEYRQNCVRLPCRRPDGFSDPRGGETERVRARRPEAGDDR